MPVGFSFFSRKPKITGEMQPGDISRLQSEQEHQRRIVEAKLSRKLRLQKERERKFGSAGVGVGRSVAQFGQVGLRQPEPFTQEQEALKQMFGGGEKIWGWKNEPVEINNDLHPSLSNDDETASCFGFGGRI